MESVHEVAEMLAKVGSFYYKNLSQEGMSVARKLTQLYSNCRVFSQFKEAGTLALSGGYTNDFGVVVHFSDKDVDYFGAKRALQVRPERDELTVKGFTALSNQDSKLLAELDREALLGQILAFPSDDTASEITVAFRDSLEFGLYINKDLFVSAITTDDSKLLLNGVDFVSYFGLILFKQNPSVLFPKGKFVASAATRRHRNLLSFVLGVDDVYGPVDKVMEYYRVSQSPRMFYLAAAQAIGMCVVPEECIVQSIEPLHKGYAYITNIGKLDAPYLHTPYSKGTILPKNTVIGGSDLFSAVFPDEALPGDLESVSLDYLLPVAGLSALQSTDISTNVVLSSVFEGSDSSKNKYLEFVKSMNEGELPSTTTDATNAIDYARDMASNRCLILRINESRMYRDMQMRLERFIERELPIGVVLLKENMVRNF